MASNNFKTMYKSKLKESTSTANRRKSRGLERQKLRDNEVNRRRLLGISDMSPVSEDMFDNHEEKNGTQGRALNRLDRLKQWREERKKKQEETRKNAKKPMFKVSHLQHKDDLQVYNKEVQNTEDKKSIKSLDSVFKLNPKPAFTQSVVQKEVKKVEAKEANDTDRKTRSVAKASKFEDKEEANVERKTRSGASKAKPAGQAVRNIEKKTLPVGKTAKLEDGANEERKTRSVMKANKVEEKASKVAIEKKDKDQPESKKTQAQLKTSSALYCKPTASAAAKSTNEKHSNFLRAKSRKGVVNKPKPPTKAAEDKVIETEHEIAPEPQNVTPERKKSVRLNTRAISIDSESEKELHLSDSNVSTPKHSTPRPARSSNRFRSSGSKKSYKKTPAIRRVRSSLRNKDKKSVREISPIEKAAKKNETDQENSESEKDAPDSDNDAKETSPERKSLNISNISDKENIHVASPRLMRSAAKKATVEEKESSSETEASLDVKISAKKYTPKLRISNLETSATPASSKNRKTRVQQDLSARSSPAKRPRSIITSPTNDKERDGESNSERSAKRARFTNLKSPSSDEEMLNVITHEVQEPDPDLPMDEADSTFMTRKSLRLGSLFSDNDSVKSPKTRVVMTTKNRMSLVSIKRQSRSRCRSQSVVVSVSDEGTSGAVGDNVIGEIHPTPEHHHKVDIACMNSTATPSVKSKKSELIDVSDEGTSLMSEHNPTVVYQVIKSEGSSRALQELTVAKIDGEISFIEVPLEDSVVLPRLSHSSENSTLSTQPFSPAVSNDVSASSSNHSPKPPATPQAVSVQTSDNQSSAPEGTPKLFKSLRRRAYSIAPVFKTPGASKSAKKERRRRKTDHLLRSPEEMVQILTKSPMVEMSRRKSRFVLSSDNVEKETESSSCEVEVLEAAQPQGTDLPNALSNNEEKMDKIKHYKQLVITESQRLNELCDKWTDYLKEHRDIPEEAQGQLLSTVGKTQLLMDQKFKQFSGLINDCEFNLGENVVNPTDLQGFWEMIYYQVEDVDKLFSKLSELEKDSWQVKQPTPQKAIKKKVIIRTSKPRVKSNFAAFRQEMIKRKATELTEPALNTSIDMATVDSDKNKVFDAGFFKVSSPIRSYGGPKKTTPVMPSVTDDPSSPQPLDSSSNSGPPLNEVAATPSSSNKENKLMATPMNRLLSTKRKSYAPAVPSPLLNDITGLRTKE